MFWIDTHCHLDAAEFAPHPAESTAVRARARAKGVALCVIPAVEAGNFEAVRDLAWRGGDAYALGLHPLYVPRAQAADLALLESSLKAQHTDARLVAVGEIGLDFFVPELCTPPLRALQERCYREQLLVAKAQGLPVLLHVRRSADRLLKFLRETSFTQGGIAHAFNGSQQQAQAFIELGFKLGFGGALTFERATQLRALARALPMEAIVLETDAPDIPPHWLYATAQQRAQGQPQGRNEPGELPRIAAVLAALRGMSVQALAQATTANALAALPRLRAIVTHLHRPGDLA